MKGVSKKWLRTFGAVFVLLSLQQLSVNAIAGSTVTVTVGEDGEVKSVGSVTPSMIQITKDILFAIDDIQYSESCESTNDGVVCNIANTPDVRMDLACGAVDDGLNCQLKPFIDDDYPPLMEVDCKKSGTNGGSCTITHNDQALKALVADKGIVNPNVLNIAESFLNCTQGAFGDAEATCSQLINAQDIETVVRILNALAPLNPEAPANLMRDNLRNSTSVIFQRLGQVRANSDNVASNVSAQQLFFANNEWLEAGTRLAANDSLASDVTPGTVSTSISDFGKLGFFLNLNATDGKYKNGSLSSKSDFSSTLLTLGFDYRVRDDLVTGLAFNVGQSKTKYKATVNGTMDAENYSLIVYNSYYKSNWYFDSSLTLGGDTYKQKRDPGLGNSFEAEYHSRQYNISLAGGYDFYVQGFGLTPFMQLDFGQLHVDGYTEKAKNSSGGGAPLAISKHKRDIGSFSAGGRFRYIFTTSKGVFIPNLTLTAVSDFKNDAQTITGRIVGLNRNGHDEFKVMAEKSDSDYFIVAAGFSMQLKNGNAGFLNLESLQGYDNLDQMRVTLGWRWEI